MSSERNLKEQRLHPSSLAFSLLKYLRQFLAPIALMFFVSKESDSWEIYGAFIVLPLMLFEAWRYFNLRYSIANGELIVRKGVFFKNVRHIPLERIQSIDSSQNFLHRMLSVADVRVETAGNTEPEAELRVLSIEARDQLRGIIFTGARTSKAAKDTSNDQESIDEAERFGQERFEFHLPAAELALLGLNPFKGLAILAVGAGIAGQVGIFENATFLGFFHVLLEGASFADHFSYAVLAVFGLGLAILTLSLLATFTILHDFTLTRDEQEFRVQCGLFTRRTTTIPIGRVQYVLVKSNPVLRAIGRSSIQIETAGGKHTPDDQTQKWLMPVVRNEYLPSLLSAIDPTIVLHGLGWHSLTHLAGRRRLYRALRASLLLAIVPCFFLETWGALALAVGLPIVTVLLLLFAHKSHRAIAWAAAPFGTLLREGVFTKSVGIVLAGRPQAITLRSSPFDRRHSMVTFRIDTAGAGADGHKIKIEYLQRDVAEALRDQLLFDLETKGQSDGLVRSS